MIAADHAHPMSKPADQFTPLVDAHYTSLYRFAYSLARRPADASDLVQQTFYIWATKGHSLRDNRKVKTWLFTTLYREFLRGRRRDQRSSYLEDMPPSAQEPTTKPTPEPERYDAQLVLAALSEIKEVFRAPLSLFYLKDLSYEEIAEALDIPVGTVMSRLSRGKAELRQLLAHQFTSADRTVIPFPAFKKGGRP